MSILDFIGKKSVAVLLLTAVFLTGFLASFVYSNIESFENLSYSGLFQPAEANSPFNHVKQEQIHVYEDRIVIDIQGASWAEFTDTNSMDPVLDIEANSIEITPVSTDDVHIGDIISYKPEDFNGYLIHRVINVSEDSEGWYATVKGDNLTNPDPGRVRFEQIEGVLVGIIY